jgi:hypothetical protein
MATRTRLHWGFVAATLRTLPARIRREIVTPLRRDFGDFAQVEALLGKREDVIDATPTRPRIDVLLKRAVALAIGLSVLCAGTVLGAMLLMAVTSVVVFLLACQAAGVRVGLAL